MGYSEQTVNVKLV